MKLSLKQLGWVTPEVTPVDIEALADQNQVGETSMGEAGISVCSFLSAQKVAEETVLSMVRKPEHCQWRLKSRHFYCVANQEPRLRGLAM